MVFIICHACLSFSHTYTVQYYVLFLTVCEGSSCLNKRKGSELKLVIHLKSKEHIFPVLGLIDTNFTPSYIHLDKPLKY